MDRAEILKKVSQSTVSAGGNNLRDGRYRLALRRFELTEGFKGSRTVFEFVVVSASKQLVVELKTGKKLDIEPNPVGSDVSLVNMLDKHESAFGNTKAAIMGLAGVTEMDEATVLETMNDMLENGAAVGRVVDVATYRKETQANKKEITLPKFYPVEQTDEDVERMKKWFSDLDAANEAQASAAATQATAPAA